MTLGVTDRDIADDVKDDETLQQIPPDAREYGLYDVEEYRLILDQTLEQLSQCPTFEISFERQWRALADEISSFFAIYVKDKGNFGYSHWWNSITRKKQGVCRSRVDGKDLIQLLSNFSFNDRPIHCLILETASDEGQSHSPYYLVQYRWYIRTRFAKTLVPAQNNSLYPFRSSLSGVPSFASIGLVEANGASTECSIQLHEENIRSMLSGDHVRVDDGRLVEMRNLLRPTDYKADYNAHVLGSSYTVTHFGFRCSSQRLASVVEEYIQRGDIFTIHVDGIVKWLGFKEINARIE
ncbi:hypothetical protein VTP01DRAFT_1956 [Rhizomucor pusillus]|uniref:uncharacterized protein n=1 Tax=Rhizomucor pusillus TaxID=4840 RepID=UPI0037423C16